MRVFGPDTRRSTMWVRRLIGYLPQQLSIDGQLTLLVLDEPGIGPDPPARGSL